jgi:hypothetical protein
LQAPDVFLKVTQFREGMSVMGFTHEERERIKGDPDLTAFLVKNAAELQPLVSANEGEVVSKVETAIPQEKSQQAPNVRTKINQFLEGSSVMGFTTEEQEMIRDTPELQNLVFKNAQELRPLLEAQEGEVVSKVPSTETPSSANDFELKEEQQQTP